MTREPPADSRAQITRAHVEAFRIPTDAPESDGTLEWSSTTLVLVTLRAGGIEGIGYTYADRATAVLAAEMLAPLVGGRDAFDAGAIRGDLMCAVRNLGRGGIAAMAISAFDNALWDLRGKLLGISVIDLIGAVRERIPVYGSGGFTSYDDTQLAAQLGGWVGEGIGCVKMKVGRDAARDRERVERAREAIGADCSLFVDANGAYSRKEALAMADAFAEDGVVWFEEPVSSDDLEGLRLLRDRAPACMDISAGEYGYDTGYFRRMLDAGAVDVLQADATRCLGITGFIEAAALCTARSLPLSAHCAPALHAQPACALGCVRHIEYFHDHARIEQMLFDGALHPAGGAIEPDRSRPGLGLDFRRSDAERYAL
ncbi:MAG TPA: enolase C-terminal domain-like protein [Rhodanobacteraceae bacterium]